LTLLYLGFGGLLLLCLYMPDNIQLPIPAGLNKLFGMAETAFAFVGMYSYSIYLWHVATLPWGLAFLRRVFHIDPAPVFAQVLYYVVSLIVGILLSRVIEYPMLRVRDRLFPSMMAQAATAAAGRCSGMLQEGVH
jgi:peptidoglycan/LPS O-acetylase OafA/YrhL